MNDSVRRTPLGLTVLALLHYQPLHPYGVQRLVKLWGKDQVVNIGQRTSVHRCIDRLAAQGLIQVRETGRDQAYPERTVYQITDAGRATAREWLDQTLAEPKPEFPEFPAALSHLLMITPAEALDALRRRVEAVEGDLAKIEAGLAASAERGLPRVTAIEDEYLRAVKTAERDWLRSVIGELESGAFRWSPEDVADLADELTS